MPTRKREGNRPDRRLVPTGTYDALELRCLAQLMTYVGSASHKLRPGDYGFVPPANPRPSKSPCDDLRSILLSEATELFTRGVLLGMVSRIGSAGVPKYVWSVDGQGEVYEAKTKAGRETQYHGYRLGEDETAMRRLIQAEWRTRSA